MPVGDSLIFKRWESLQMFLWNKYLQTGRNKENRTHEKFKLSLNLQVVATVYFLDEF